MTHQPSIPRRIYKNGEELSIVGLGVIVLVGMEQDDANRLVAESIDRGLNYIDTGPRYGGGEAQEKMGHAVRPHRSDLFIGCKTRERDAGGARKELEHSLRQLHTDHVDLYQFHAVSTMEDVQKIVGPGGAGEAFLKAREEGLVRYVGLSAHNEEAAIALMDQFDCDSVLFPVNFGCFAKGNFGPRILQHARDNGVTRLALKALAHTTWKENEQRTYANCWYRPISHEHRDLASRALRFTLSQDVTAAIAPGDGRMFRLALDLATRFEPLLPAERDELLAEAEDLEPIFAN